MNELQIFEQNNIESLPAEQALTIMAQITHSLLARQQAKLQELEKDVMEQAQRLRAYEEKQAHTNRVVNKYVNQGEFGACFNPVISAPNVKKLWKILGMWNTSAGYDQPYAKDMQGKNAIFTQVEWDANGDVRYQWRIHAERGTDHVYKLLKGFGLLSEWNAHKTPEERAQWIADRYRRQS